MEINEYGQVVITEQEAIDALYSGKITDLSNLFLNDVEIVKQFNHSLELNADRISTVSGVKLPSIDVQEFDKQNQNDWFMPDDYKNFDIENWLLCQAKDIRSYSRVEEELALFRQHNMITLLKYLKYLVDTMRQNNIIWGVGRGSSVASYVLFLLGVHKIDSIKYKLDINEFLK